jgi:hypothetical protein
MTQAFQLFDAAPGGLLSVALIEVRGPHLLVGHLVREHVIDDHQDGVPTATTAFLWPRCRMMRR